MTLFGDAHTNHLLLPSPTHTVEDEWGEWEFAKRELKRKQKSRHDKFLSVLIWK